MSKTLTATVVSIDPEAFLSAAFPADPGVARALKELDESRLDEERHQRFMSKLAKCMNELDANPL